MITWVEKGYDDLVDEYTNDLYCRNWLYQVWVLLPAEVIDSWTPQIRRLDGRFKAATVFDDGQALSYYHRLPDEDLWWWRRYPRLLTGDLGRALRSAGATD